MATSATTTAPLRRRRWFVPVLAGTLAATLTAGVLAVVASMPVVPSLANQSLAQAQAQASAVGLKVVVSSDCADLPAEACEVESQSPEAGQRVRWGSQVRVSMGPIELNAPNVVGMTMSDAIDALAESWLVPEVTFDLKDPRAVELAAGFAGAEVWRVLAQEDEGSWSVAGETIELTIAPGKVAVPDVVGLNLEDAQLRLQEAGLLLDAPRGVPSDGVAGSQSVKAGWQVEFGTLIAVDFMNRVPDVTGMNPAEAMHALESAGFALADAPGVPEDALASGQSVPAGTSAAVGTSISVTFQVTVPDVDGLTWDEAADAIESVGLVAVVSPQKPSWNWNLVDVDPMPGTVVDSGSRVTLTYEEPVVEYKVTGNGSRALITWIAPGASSIQQDTSASVPWVTEFSYSTSYGTISAQALNGTEITCTITVDGRIVDQNTSKGAYTIVMCST